MRDEQLCLVRWLQTAAIVAQVERRTLTASEALGPFDVYRWATHTGSYRRSPCMMACAMAVPLEGASPRLPLVSVLPVGVSMVGRESVAAMCTAYTPPLP